MLETGWGIDPCEQTLVHSAGVKVPIELQNKSMVVKGWIRVTNEASNETDMQQPASICAGKADVTPDLRFGPTGWNATVVLDAIMPVVSRIPHWIDRR